MSVLSGPHPIELDAIAATRAELRRRLETGLLTDRQAATRLGLSDQGFYSVLNREWALDECFRIAMTLGIDFASFVSNELARAA